MHTLVSSKDDWDRYEGLQWHAMAEYARAADDRDYSEVNHLHALLTRPFDEQPEYDAYAAEPPDWARKIEVSCSS